MKKVYLLLWAAIYCLLELHTVLDSLRLVAVVIAIQKPQTDISVCSVSSFVVCVNYKYQRLVKSD